MLSVKQVSIKYHFLSLWYDSIWDWTQVSRPLANTLSIIPIFFFFFNMGMIKFSDLYNFSVNQIFGLIK